MPDIGALPPLPASHTRAALQAWYDDVGEVWAPAPNPLPPLPAPSSLDAIQLAVWVGQAQAALANVPSTVKIDTVPRPVVRGWTFSNSLPPSMFQVHALTVPPSLPVPYKWVQDVWLEAAQYDYESELARSPLERGTLLLDDRQVDICAAVDAEGVVGEVTTTVPAPTVPGVLSPVAATAVTRPWDPSMSRDPRSKGRAIVAAWGTAEARLGNRLSGAARPAAAPLSFLEPRAMDMFLRRAARLGRSDARNLPLADFSRLFRLAAGDVRQLDAAGVANASSLAAALLGALGVERLSGADRALRGRRAGGPVASPALPPALAHRVIRAIGMALDASLEKGGPRPPGPRHAHRRERRRRRTSARRAMRRSSSGLVLGPIVGHTDDTSTRIWIQAGGDPAGYTLRVPGRGLFPFVSTEGPQPEFGTAIAVADGLRPDERYQYSVLRRGHVVRGGRGRFAPCGRRPGSSRGTTSRTRRWGSCATAWKEPSRSSEPLSRLPCSRRPARVS